MKGKQGLGAGARAPSARVTTHRRATPADFAAIGQVALASWHHAYGHLQDAALIESQVAEHYHPRRLAQLLERADAGRKLFEVAVQDAQVIGFLVVDVSAPNARMQRLYVLPAYIGRGVGKALLKHGEELLQMQRVQRYSCFVHVRNELAKTFYLRQGFRHVEAKDTDEDWYLEKSLSRLDHVVQFGKTIARRVLSVLRVSSS